MVEPPLKNKTGVPNDGPQGDLNSVPELLKLNKRGNVGND